MSNAVEKTPQALVAGGGLAGCEAAWQLANAGVAVRLVEMKPQKYTPAHHSPDLSELVCSNSLKAFRLESAPGLLKEEMKRLGSLLIPCAEQTAVPAGGALAVDRLQFSRLVTEKIRKHPLITVEEKELAVLPYDGSTHAVIATGPLTSEALAEDIQKHCGSALRFYDAAAPIVTADSLNQERIFFASRYGKGDADYLNCYMDKEEYEIFYSALVSAETAPLHDMDRPDGENFAVYEGCMPVEVLAKRGVDALRFGPMKPVGLTDPRTGRRPWAALQLRKENREGTLYNLVGFQTNLKFGEQKRVFGLIPGLEAAEFVRYGVMHRNSFLDSPRLLSPDLSLRQNDRLYFAGQLTGVEGYTASAASGLLAGKNLARKLTGGKGPLILPRETMLGALTSFITGGSSLPSGKFQPIGPSMGLLPPLEEQPPVRGKQNRYRVLAERALTALEKTLSADCSAP